jgi:hypothetical protein
MEVKATNGAPLGKSVQRTKTGIGKMLKKSLTIGLALGGALALGAPALAADFTWIMESGTNCSSGAIGGAAPCNWGNTRTYNSSPGGGPGVTASAWSFTGDTGGGTNNTLQNAYLAVYGGGLGITNRDRGSNPGQDANEGHGFTPEHAIDSNQRYELVKLEFGGLSPIALKQVQVNYVSNDSDISVFYYPTALGAPSSLDGKDLVGDGWTLLGHFDGDDTANNVYNFNAGGAAASRFWLISTYLPGFGGSLDGGDDKFKLYKAGGSTSNGGKVPEPATALLFGIAFLGLWRSARKLQRA